MRIATLVTRREDEITRDVIGKTSTTQADLKVIARPWYHVLGIRVGRVYLMSLLGMLGGESINIIDIDGVPNFLIASLGPALVSLIVNSIELLNKLDTNENYVAYRG